MRRNVRRDADNLARLADLGWRTEVVWECEIREDVTRPVERVRRHIASSSGRPQATVNSRSPS